MGLQRWHAPQAASGEGVQSLELEAMETDTDAGVGETAQQRHVGDTEDATDENRWVQHTGMVKLEPHVWKHAGRGGSSAPGGA